MANDMVAFCHCAAIFAVAGAIGFQFASHRSSLVHNYVPTSVRQGTSVTPVSHFRANVVHASQVGSYAFPVAQAQPDAAGETSQVTTKFGFLTFGFMAFAASLFALFKKQPSGQVMQAEPFAMVAVSAEKGKKEKKARKDRKTQKSKTEKKEKPPPLELPRKVVFARMRKGVLRRAKKPTKTTGRVCALLGKVDNRKARQISFSHIRTKRIQRVNLQWKRLYWEEAKMWVRLRLSTKGIKTITKYGLHQAAVKFGLDLTKHLNGVSERKYIKYLPEKEKKLAMIRGAYSRYLSAVRWAKLNDEEVPPKPANLLTPLQRKRKNMARKRAARKAEAAEPTEIAMAISHGKRLPRLGRPADQRKALLRGLTTQLIRHGRIMTTIVKARAVRKHVDHMISLAKGGSLHERRQALAYIYDKDLVKTLFEQVPERYPTREGGYTRIIRTMPRKGDCASMCFIELV